MCWQGNYAGLRAEIPDLKLSGKNKTRRVRGCPSTTKKLLPLAFILLSTVQIAREIVRYKENSFTLKQSKRTQNFRDTLGQA